MPLSPVMRTGALVGEAFSSAAKTIFIAGDCPMSPPYSGSLGASSVEPIGVEAKAKASAANV